MLYDISRLVGEKEKEIEWENLKGGGIPVVLLSQEGKDIRQTELPVFPNVLTLGVTGTGKTRSFTIPAARYLLERNPLMRAVFFEPKTTFTENFYRKGDKIVAYDESYLLPDIDPSALFRWNMIKEIRQAKNTEAEIRQITEFLFGKLLTGADNNRAWVESARNTFAAVLRVIVDCTDKNTTNRQLISSLRNMSIEELLRYISQHPRNQSLLKKDFSYDASSDKPYVPTRRATDIMFFFNSVIEDFTGSFTSDGTDTISDFMKGAYGKNLFLLYDLSNSSSISPFICYFLKKIKDEQMSLSNMSTRDPILWVMDEVDKLAEGGKAVDFGLYQAATLGRESGLHILLSTQSMENLYSLSANYNEHSTEGGLAGFPCIVSFRPGDSKTITTLQTLFGSKRKETVIMPLSRYDKPQIKSEVEPLVSEYDLASLETGEAYVKIKSAEPTRIRFILQDNLQDN